MFRLTAASLGQNVLSCISSDIPPNRAVFLPGKLIPALVVRTVLGGRAHRITFDAREVMMKRAMMLFLAGLLLSMTSGARALT